MRERERDRNGNEDEGDSEEIEQVPRGGSLQASLSIGHLASECSIGARGLLEESQARFQMGGRRNRAQAPGPQALLSRSQGKSFYLRSDPCSVLHLSFFLTVLAQALVRNPLFSTLELEIDHTLLD